MKTMGDTALTYSNVLFEIRFISIDSLQTFIFLKSKDLFNLSQWKLCRK